MDKNDIFKMMEKAILEGDNEGANQGAREAVQQGIDLLVYYLNIHDYEPPSCEAALL